MRERFQIAAARASIHALIIAATLLCVPQVSAPAAEPQKKDPCKAHRDPLVSAFLAVCEGTYKEISGLGAEIARLRERTAAIAKSARGSGPSGQRDAFDELATRHADLEGSMLTEKDLTEAKALSAKLQASAKRNQAAVKSMSEQYDAIRGEALAEHRDQVVRLAKQISLAHKEQQDAIAAAQAANQDLKTFLGEFGALKSQLDQVGTIEHQRGMDLGSNLDPANPRRDKTIFASPDGRPHNGQATLKLADAVREAKPGDTIQLTPGTYREPIELVGPEKRDITIKGERDEVTREVLTKFDGGQKPTVFADRVAENGDIYAAPKYDRFAMIKLDKTSGIKIEDIEIRDAWPVGVYIRNSSNIEIARTDFFGGTQAVFGDGSGTRGIKIQDSTWVQDTSGKLWTTVPFMKGHHGEYNYFNGAFFGGRNIGGDVEISSNDVSDAYNVVRVTCRNDSACPPGANSNVVMKKNNFTRIRDNVLECEGRCTGWVYAENTCTDCYKAISGDGATGDIGVYGSTFKMTEQAGSDVRRQHELQMSANSDPLDKSFLDPAGPGRAPADAPLTNKQITGAINTEGAVFKIDETAEKGGGLTIRACGNTFDATFMGGQVATRRNDTAWGVPGSGTAKLPAGFCGQNNTCIGCAIQLEPCKGVPKFCPEVP